MQRSLLNMRDLMIVMGVLFLSCITVFAEGGETSGGVETDHFSAGHVWFADKDKKIRTCFVYDQQFGLKPNELEQTIQRAFEIWNTYFDLKRPSRLLANGIDTLASTIEMLPTCDGSEDLKFKFGVKDKEVEDAARTLRKPLGMAHLISYDDEKLWSKGFIWAAGPASIYPDKNFPDWTKPNRLLGLLLHEVGHIFGFEHVHSTVMSENLAGWIQIPNEESGVSLTKIDLGNELILCKRCGPYPVSTWESAEFHIKEAFKMLVGRDAVGEVDAKFEVFENDYSGYAKLEYSDALGKYEFGPLRMRPSSVSVVMGSMFKTVKRGWVVADVRTANQNLAFLQLPNGEKRMIAMDFGLDWYHQVVISLIPTEISSGRDPSWIFAGRR